MVLVKIGNLSKKQLIFEEKESLSFPEHPMAIGLGMHPTVSKEFFMLSLRASNNLFIKTTDT